MSNDTFNMRPRLGEERKHVVKFYQGENMVIYTPIDSAFIAGAINSTTSDIDVLLTDRRFATEGIWEGSWDNGVTLLNGETNFISITIPRSVSDLLRRGSFMLSIGITDKITDNMDILEPIYIEIDYSGLSPNKSVPYHPDGDSAVDPPAED